MITFPATHFVREPTEVRFARYANDHLAVYTIDPDGQPAIKLSVNLEEMEAPTPRPHEFWCKTWSENQGVLEAIRSSGLAVCAGSVFSVNDFGSRAHLMRLTAAGIAELTEQEATRGNS